MNPPADISIALATYQGERYLARQLDSLAAQSLQPAELVVGDDGSTDDTIAIVRAFAARAPFPVRIQFNARRLGYRRNFIEIAGRCQSPLTAFCDQDDVWHRDKLATLRPLFDDAEVQLVYHNAHLIDADGERFGHLYDAATHRRNLGGPLFYPWHDASGFTQVMRTKLVMFDDLWPLSRDHFSDDPQAHDQWYLFLALVTGEVRFVDSDLADYRQHASNVAGAGGRRTLRERVRGKFAYRVDRDRQAAAASERRAAIVTLLVPRLAEGARAKARRFATLYAELSRWHAQRDRVFAETHFGARARSMMRLVSDGAYWQRPRWGLDWRELPRDIVSGIVR